MIGKLKGILDEIEESRVILDVSGVGYVVYCSEKTLSCLPGLGEAASFLINMHVKEDDISLFGFIERAEQEWFDNIITVQGIGPKLALVILSSLDPAQLINSIIDRKAEDFKHIAGVGPKLAERIFTELSKKANLYIAKYPNMSSKAPVSNQAESYINDALSALTSLGYSRNEAYNICKNITQEKPDISINELIRSALKELSS